MYAWLRRWWLLWLVVFMLLVVAYLPARLITWVLPPSISLEGVSGTLWSGSASRAAVIVDRGVIMLGQLDWQWRPFALFTADFAADVTSTWGSQTFVGQISTNWRGELSIHESSLVVDVDWIRNLLPLYVQGRLQADFKRLEFRDRQLQAADGRIVWSNAAWAARAGSLPLGSYVVEVAGVGSVIDGRVLTLSGGLQAGGELALENDKYRVDVHLSGPALSNEGLRQSIALFAVPDGPNYRIQLNGSL